VRDDVYPLTPAERRAALAGWRAIPAPIRWATGRLAEKGLPADDTAVSVAAGRYGECLLQRNRSNRLPRCSMTAMGVAMLLAGLFLTSTSWAATAVPAMCIAGGAVGTALGLFSWGQRRAGRLLVEANPPVVAPADAP
jgi:hypothetical protein